MHVTYHETGHGASPVYRKAIAVAFDCESDDGPRVLAKLPDFCGRSGDYLVDSPLSSFTIPLAPHHDRFPRVSDFAGLPTRAAYTS